MKLFSKKFLGVSGNPFNEVISLRCTITADYPAKTFYLTSEKEITSCGVSFVMKEGYSTVRPTENNLSVGTKDGYTFWVSSQTRPLSLDYYFSVWKNGSVYDTYRVIVSF